MTPPEIFDRNARRIQRGRVGGGGFLNETLANDLLERLDSIKREFRRALIIGAEPLLSAGLTARSIAYDVTDPAPARAALAMEEDRLTITATTYDLVLASGTLDTVSDLPGALLLIRRALVPDGLLLANFFGAPSLPALRHAIALVDGQEGRAVARLHPQIDVRSGGDLLVRAGFALPVADVDTLDIGYVSLGRLLADLRAAAATNVLAQRLPATRGWLTRLNDAFKTQADTDGRTRETLSYITLTGWAPGPGQPEPARRGSATASLAAALKPKS